MYMHKGISQNTWDPLQTTTGAGLKSYTQTWSTKPGEAILQLPHVCICTKVLVKIHGTHYNTPQGQASNHLCRLGQPNLGKLYHNSPNNVVSFPYMYMYKSTCQNTWDPLQTTTRAGRISSTQTWSTKPGEAISQLPLW